MSRGNITIPRNGFQSWKGYNSDPLNCPDDFLSSPSENCLIDENGNASQRLGFAIETKIDLSSAGSPSTSFYHEQYDVTIFATGTSVKYYNWADETVYDTGLTLTDGTTTRFDSYAGDVYLTNTTDGLYRLVFGKINDAAATSGDATVTIDTDMAARLSVFGLGSDTLRINGTEEAYTSLVVGTGVVTLTGTLSQSYTDNTIAVVTHDVSITDSKASQVFFWKERMGLFGQEVAGNSDQPNSTIYFGKFAGPDTLEDVVNFTFGAGGATTEIIGHYGKVRNVIPSKDFLYAFNDRQGFSAAAADVITSGAGIGGTPFDLRDENNGCLNEDSSSAIGNNEIIYITNDKRIIRIRIATQDGAAVLFPDEEFDIPIREDLKNMDDEQDGALVFYHRAKRRTICQVKIGGQIKWLVYDHNIGAWQPPQSVISAKSFFERKGILYVTDDTDDTVYSVNTAFSDIGSPISCVVATGNFSVGNSAIMKARMLGQITQGAEINLQSFVVNKNGGLQGGSKKIIDGASFGYSEAHGIGADAVGGGGVEGETIAVAGWEAEWGVFPSQANRVQLIATNEVGGNFSISGFIISAISYSNTATATL